MTSRRFTYADLVFGFACGLVALSIMLVRIQVIRSAARQSRCADNLSQLGRAMHNYHSVFKRFPMGCGGTFPREGAGPTQNNGGRLSALVGITPFLDEQALWEKISNPIQVGAIRFPPMGPVPWYDPKQYSPWQWRPQKYGCPSDENAVSSVASSYKVNYGDAVIGVGHEASKKWHANKQNAMHYAIASRGVFGSHFTGTRNILDGTSNTLMFSEAGVSKKVARGISGLSLSPTKAIDASRNPTSKFWPLGHQACWADGCLRSGGFQGILAPNSASATSDAQELEGIMSASSYHHGGVHVCFADASVQFVLNSIDAGDSKSPTVGPVKTGHAEQGSPSPYGLWGALATKSMKENIRQQTAGSNAITPPPTELSDLEKADMESKPMLTWALANKANKFQARFVSLNGTHVNLLTETGDVKCIVLNDFTSEDAYRAIELDLLKKLGAKQKLIQQLQSGVTLIEEKQYAKFAEQFIIGGNLDSESMGRHIEMHRGSVLQTLDGALRYLNDRSYASQIDQPRNQTNFNNPISSSSSGEEIFLIPPSAAKPKMILALETMQHLDGQWKFTPNKPTRRIR